MITWLRLAAVLSQSLLMLASAAFGQGGDSGGTDDLPQDSREQKSTEMPGMNHAMQMNAAGMFLMNMASGTSLNPQSWPMPMFMPRIGPWNLMLMGQAFIVDTQQSGPRGGDKLYSPNAFMVSAERSIGNGSLVFQSMLSLEPATIANRSYPLLLTPTESQCCCEWQSRTCHPESLA